MSSSTAEPDAPPGSPAAPGGAPAGAAPRAAPAPPAAAPGAIERWLARRVLGALAALERGRLELRLPDGSVRRFGAREDAGVPGPVAAIDVRSWAFFPRVALGGDLGFAESFVDGEWTTPDLTAVISLFIANEEVLAGEAGTPSLLRRAADRLDHLRRRNTPGGSRRNIRAHYDLGNDFFQLFLDATMTYSCGLFERPDEPLETVQLRKIRRILDKAQLAPGMHLLEIGCGWGSTALTAAREYGVRVTGLTVSEEQRAWALARVREAGLADQVAIELCDYRHARGSYDRVVSIEMLEAVGHEYFGAYFAAIDRLLAPGGRGVIQVITLPDQRYEGYLGRVDFIQKHVFPGAVIPSLTALCEAMTRASSLVVEQLENIGPHYAPTLAAWRRRFLAQAAELARLGFDPRFQRTWEYYFAYCEAGFASRYLNDLQLVLTRPGLPALPRTDR
ncbi:MAG: cyclopropane-fatty-acyl-phospholipid synthase family protein [Acidobacteria bacterium]|jgi:cyclopropane-fatty-acyl-phospholipid synthase|nr:cyclopropane-fatty-acyl-phospholipid synthase family protein [Acidobacteriota bacterium]